MSAITSWQNLADEFREALTGKLSGMWGAASDEAAFDSLPLDKQQALLIFTARLRAKGLWQLIRKITNVYGEGGVGLGFAAWPLIISTLDRRKDFTRRFANHQGASGGFYEKARSRAALHFLYQDGESQEWQVHFDLYSPVHSPESALNHWRHEVIGKLTPDWKMIRGHLQGES